MKNSKGGREGVGEDGAAREANGDSRLAETPSSIRQASQLLSNFKFCVLCGSHSFTCATLASFLPPPPVQLLLPYKYPLLISHNTTCSEQNVVFDS